ncbi:hypothetical protein BDK63_002977 [Halomonas campaniensis]|uniref:Uncharacterized protein n=1 Tax=Halomonas campaniensis TaxID=213554 RepID=A0A7W5K518_9GAMM|nr:hypothetical protein [Halomonas campaniensis]
MPELLLMVAQDGAEGLVQRLGARLLATAHD